MRVLPALESTAPRFPREKSYSFFIRPSLVRFSLSNRNQTHVLGPLSPGDNHHSAEGVHPNRHPTSLAIYRIVFHSYGERVPQNTVPLGQRHTVLGEVQGVFLRIVLGTHASICILCIPFKIGAAWRECASVFAICETSDHEEPVELPLLATGWSGVSSLTSVAGRSRGRG